MFYGLTADRVKRIMRNPKRVEEGVAENTIAVMCPYGTSPGGRQPYKGEIWVMYQRVESGRLKVESRGNINLKPHSTLNSPHSKSVIISAWRYPGVSPIGKAIPIPPDILDELKSGII